MKELKKTCCTATKFCCTCKHHKNHPSYCKVIKNFIPRKDTCGVWEAVKK